MVLTPDQKKRIAELGAKPPEAEEEQPKGAPRSTAKLRAFWLTAGASGFRNAVGKVLILCVVVAAAGYFVVDYQLYNIDWNKVISRGPRTPIDRLWYALKLQKQKADMLDDGNTQFLVGDYDMALKTAAAVLQMDAQDSRAKHLTSLATDAAIMKAAREFESGEIEAALGDVRLALQYAPEHKEAKELSLRIGERLLREAKVHYRKKEYPQLIRKAQEILKINPSDMDARNLLVQANKELLTRADELFISRRYAGALEDVMQSLRIDPNNHRARSLEKQIRLYIGTPELELRGIVKSGTTLYALILVPESNQPLYVKEDDTFRNFKVLSIDSQAKVVKLLQIHTNKTFSIGLHKGE